MRLATIDSIPAVVPVRRGFRGGDIAFRDLMTGTEGTPGNYGLQLVEVADSYTAPRHRHNFEQVRVMLAGAFGFGPGQVQDAGSVGYFCEGTAYTQAGDGPSTTLLLQIGGPSRQGFMSRRQLREGIDALSGRGTFESGVYTWRDGAGKTHHQDSYEAVWEHVHGRPVAYPRPQYDAPILFRPDRFAWRPLPSAEGVDERHFGVFNGRGLGLSALRLEAGAGHALPSDDRERLVFCLAGSGRVEDRLAFAPWSTLALDPGEGATVRAETATELFVFRLPDFLDDDRARQPVDLQR